MTLVQHIGPYKLYDRTRLGDIHKEKSPFGFTTYAATLMGVSYPSLHYFMAVAIDGREIAAIEIDLGACIYDSYPDVTRRMEKALYEFRSIVEDESKKVLDRNIQRAYNQIMRD